MKFRSKIAASTAAVAALASGGAVLAPAAHAATTATFTINAGSLAIAPPSGTVNLGSVSAGSLLFTSSNFGAVSVSDQRGSLVSTWTASVDTTNFATGTDTSQIVPKASIAYASGAGTNATGTVGLFTPATVASFGATPQVGGTFAGTGSNTVSWTPTMTFTLAANQVAGTYTGTVTHSIA
jgi:hypothetical protein